MVFVLTYTGVCWAPFVQAIRAHLTAIGSAYSALNHKRYRLVVDATCINYRDYVHACTVLGKTPVRPPTRIYGS